jgi:hypothetical protein
MKWTVARFPSGNWTTGGKPNDPDYADCEVFVIEAPDRKTATKRAQAKRTRQRRAEGLIPATCIAVPNVEITGRGVVNEDDA